MEGARVTEVPRQPPAAAARPAQIQHPQPHLPKPWHRPLRRALDADAPGGPTGNSPRRSTFGTQPRLARHRVLRTGPLLRPLLRPVARLRAAQGERHPAAFWFFSLAGGLVLLAYAIHRNDPVFILGQATGFVIYSRNLWFIYRGGRRRRPPRPQGLDAVSRRICATSSLGAGRPCSSSPASAGATCGTRTRRATPRWPARCSSAATTLRAAPQRRGLHPEAAAPLLAHRRGVLLTGGVDEVSARLPSALAAIGAVLLVFRIGERLFNRRAGWLAAAPSPPAPRSSGRAASGRSTCSWLPGDAGRSGSGCGATERERGTWARPSLPFFFVRRAGHPRQGPGRPPAAAPRDPRSSRRRVRPGRACAALRMGSGFAALGRGGARLAPAGRPSPAGREYLEQIVFRQNVTRYADPWHHFQPWYYYLSDDPARVLPLVLLCCPRRDRSSAGRGWTRERGKAYLFALCLDGRDRGLLQSSRRPSGPSTS